MLSNQSKERGTGTASPMKANKDVLLPTESSNTDGKMVSDDTRIEGTHGSLLP